MPIQFRCPQCSVRLSIGRRKAGTRIQCPRCATATTVPLADEQTGASGPSLLDTAGASGQSSPLRWWLVGGLSTAVVALAIALALALSGGKTNAVASDAHRLASVSDKKVPAAPGMKDPPAQLEGKQPAAKVVTLPARLPEPKSQRKTPEELPPQVIKPEPPKEEPAAKEEPKEVFVLDRLDHFGNPTADSGLARGAEFKGKRLLVWCRSTPFMERFFGNDNPLWKALAKRGFEVVRRSGRFNESWLRDADQLWIISLADGRRIPDESKSVDLALMRREIKMELESIPEEEWRKNFPHFQAGDVTDDLIDDLMVERLAALEPPAIGERGFQAIERFVKSGKGLYLLAENEPFYYEADVLAQRWYGTPVRGNYPGGKIAYINGRGLSPEQIARYKGEYAVADHPLLSGVNFFFEGFTISHLEPCAGLAPVLHASDGNILMAMSTLPGERVVIDCGWTRYCHGRARLTQYVTMTAGTVRLAENVAAYLAGKQLKGR
jgi:hypothetical protein